MKFLRSMKNACLLASVLTAGAYSFTANATETLKWAHVYDPGTPFHQWALKAAELIKEKTEGRYEIRVFPSSSLGKEADINEALGLGTVDMIFTSPEFAARSYKLLGVGSAPYVFASYEHWKSYRDSQLFGELVSGYEKATGNELLAMNYYGQRHVTSNKAIKIPVDMEGLKIRVPNAPTYRMFPDAVRANATPLAFSEVYLALQQGAVDAQENPLLTIKSMKFNEVQKHISLTGHMTGSLITVASGITWKGLSVEDRKIIEDTIRMVSAELSEDVRNQENEAVSWFESEGNIINTVDVESFRDIVLPHVKDKLSEEENQVLSKIQALL